MIWVVRAGKNGKLYDRFIEQEKVYLAWDGYDYDLISVKDMESCRSIVMMEKQTNNSTSISNWAGQLFCFVNEMRLDDYVLIPSRGSRSYALALIKSEYKYDNDGENQFRHYRKIELLTVGIPRSIFAQRIMYSLNAFRTLFKAKYENEIIDTISKWKEYSK